MGTYSIIKWYSSVMDFLSRLFSFKLFHAYFLSRNDLSAAVDVIASITDRRELPPKSFLTPLIRRLVEDGNAEGITKGMHQFRSNLKMLLNKNDQYWKVFQYVSVFIVIQGCQQLFKI